MTLLDNSTFSPGDAADAAPPFIGRVNIHPTRMRTIPELPIPIIGGCDARLFPGFALTFFTLESTLVPMERGEMLGAATERGTGSYWRAIAQPGRVWRDRGEGGGWAHAAFPLMLVDVQENLALQGLAAFLYREDAVKDFHCQFVQQSAPYLLKPHFIAWAETGIERDGPGPADPESARRRYLAESGQRLPSKPWSVRRTEDTPIPADGPGGQSDTDSLVAAAWVRNGTLFYRDVSTPCGMYPYPLEMRFGVRSVMKSVGAPLALLRLAEIYGPFVMELKVGDYVQGVDAKYRRVRFLDAANMTTGFGGVGTWRTHPNDPMDGHLDGDYDAWYTAPSHAEKLAQIARTLRPYPWEPGTVMRYRDQDYYLLGCAIDGFIKSIQGPRADAWTFVKDEVLSAIGIWQAPAIRTCEPGHRLGMILFNAGYYPTLEDLARIAMLYQQMGEWAGRQILNRDLTQALLSAQKAIAKNHDCSADPSAPSRLPAHALVYKMGFHFTPYVEPLTGKPYQLPTMRGDGGNEVVLYPHRVISIRVCKDSSTTCETLDSRDAKEIWPAAQTLQGCPATAPAPGGDPSDPSTRHGPVASPRIE